MGLPGQELPFDFDPDLCVEILSDSKTNVIALSICQGEKPADLQNMSKKMHVKVCQTLQNALLVAGMALTMSMNKESTNVKDEINDLIKKTERGIDDGGK